MSLEISSTPRARSDQPSEVRVVSEVDELLALRDAWNRVASRAARQSVFLRHEWFESAWQWRGTSAELYLLCYYLGGELAGVCPLVRDEGDDASRRGRTLQFLTVPDTQLCDLIVAPQHREPTVSAFAGALEERRREWDLLDLRYLPQDSIAATDVLKALSNLGFRTQRQVADANPYVALDTSWDAYYATRSRSLKKANNLAANRLKKAGEVRIEQLAPGAGTEADLDRLVAIATAISARSWKSRTGNSLDNQGPQAFIKRLSVLAHRRGWLSIWLLSLNGQPLAMEYQLVADGNVYALRSDFDAACDEISPGSHLARHLLEELFEQGLRRYSMGPGENPYKYRWTEVSEPVEQAMVFSRTLRGRALAAWTLALKPTARRLRDRLGGKPVSSGSERTEDGGQP